MAKKSTTTENRILLNENREKAEALISKIETEVIPHIEYLKDIFAPLEIGPMNKERFNDLMSNDGKGVQSEFEADLQEKLKSLPSSHLIQLATNAAMSLFDELLTAVQKARYDYGSYFKYLSFEGDTVSLTEETKEQIFEAHREYESVLASELRKKHQAALDVVNAFFLMLKELKPDFHIFNQSLVQAFTASPEDLQAKQPFSLNEVNYQALAGDAEEYNQNELERKVQNTAYQLEALYRENSDKDPMALILSAVEKLKQGSAEDRAIAESNSMAEFLEGMKIKTDYTIGTVPTVRSVHPTL